MVAGNFQPKSSEKNSSKKRWGKNRDSSAGGGITSNFQNAVNVWVDVRAFIYSYDGNTYDITDDIISGSLQRNTDQPTTMSITFANEGDKYRQMFIPNDRIVLFLRRNETEWQSFTGYIHNTPVFNLYSSRELTLNCSCIIRRLNQKFWDENLRENIFVLSSGPISPQPGTSTEGTTTPSTTPSTTPTEQNAEAAPTQQGSPDTTGAPTADPVVTNLNPTAGEPVTPDQTLAFLLTAPDHIGIKPEMVLIQAFPQEWKERAAQITAQNLPCMTTWENLIVCPDDKDCSESGSSTPPGTIGGCEDGQTLGSVIDQAGWPSSERDRAIQTAFCESGGDAGVVNTTDSNAAAGTPSIGLFQIILPTAQGVDSSATEEKLKDPLFNAQTARKLWEQQGWSPWSCAPGVGQYGNGSDSTPISNCTTTEGNVVANMEAEIANAISGVQLANASGACDDSNWDYTASGPTTHNHSSLVKGIIDDVTSKWNVYTNTYPGHPGGEENSVDFWASGGRGSPIDSTTGQEIHDYLTKNYSNVINWLIWEGQMDSDGGTSPDTSGFGHYDHVHMTAGSDDCGGGTIDGAGGGSGFDPSGQPCGSGRGGQTPTATTPGATTNPSSVNPAEEGETGNVTSADASIGVIRKSNDNLRRFVIEGRNMIGTPFKWGGGHGYDLELEGIKSRGVDASGLFNYIRYIMGLSPYDIGSTAEYFNFLDEIKRFDPRRSYPIGTILINPGDWQTMGHMGMVIDDQGKVLEANATGKVVTRYNVRESSFGWAGYTHVGIMPDVNDLEFVLFASANRKEREKEQYDKFQQELKKIKENPHIDNDETIGYCDIHHDDVEALEAIGWDTVGEDKIVYYDINSKYATYFKRAVNKWNDLNGVQILPATGSDRVDLRVYDGDRGSNIFATTSSDGWLEYDISNMDEGTENLKEAVSVHELGHALGLAHSPVGVPSVMQSSFITNSNNNIDSPTEYDVQEYDALWGGISIAHETTSGIANVEADDEPCITRHPLGVYKLAANAATETAGSATILAEAKRRLALSSGKMASVKEYLESEEDPDISIDAYQQFPELWEECTEVREWRHIAELDKTPYMPTIQDVADSGLYTMMSIGTGEIVFWYPWIVGDMSAEVAQPGEVGDEQTGVTPSEGITPAQYELQSPTEMSGVALKETHADVLEAKMYVKDIDLVDFSLYVSDDSLVTHYFVLGEYRFLGGTLGGLVDLKCWRWSTIFDNPLMVAQSQKTAHFDPFAFIQRYGVRSKSEHVKAIKIPGMAQIWAEQQWLKHWLNCYIIQLQTTFMPEIYPGNHLVIESLGVEVVVLQATHTFGSSWTTKITVSMPLAITDETKIPPLPFWTLFTTEMANEGLNPTVTPEGMSTSGSATSPFGTPLEVSGDLWDSINAKRDADNARVRRYLDDWKTLKDSRFGFDALDDFLKGELPGQQPAPDTSGEPLSSDALKVLFQVYPYLKNVPGIENMTREQIKKQFPEVKL